MRREDRLTQAGLAYVLGRQALRWLNCAQVTLTLSTPERNRDTFLLSVLAKTWLLTWQTSPVQHLLQLSLDESNAPRLVLWAEMLPAILNLGCTL